MIDERKATDMAAYLLSKEKSGEMHYKKLMGLMYLSERKFMKNYSDLIVEDYFEAKEHGPVLSETYKLMEGKRISSVGANFCDDMEDDVLFDIWNSKINKLDDYLSVKKEVLVNGMNKLWLSIADKETMDEIWEEFGHLSERELRKYIKNTCLEWRTARKSTGRKYEGYEDKKSFPNQITAEVVGEQLGMTQSDINGVKYVLNPLEWKGDMI